MMKLKRKNFPIDFIPGNVGEAAAGGSPCNRRALQLLVPNVTFLSKSADEKKVKQLPFDFNVKTKYLRAIKASAKTAGDRQLRSLLF